MGLSSKQGTSKQGSLKRGFLKRKSPQKEYLESSKQILDSENNEDYYTNEKWLQDVESSQKSSDLETDEEFYHQLGSPKENFFKEGSELEGE